MITNKQPTNIYNSSLMSKVNGTKIESNLNHFHLSRLRVYVLKEKLQQLKSHNKTSDQLWVIIFIYHSSFHASNVPTKLNIPRGNMSPQLHCIYYDEFSTCKIDAKITSLWKHKAKLQSQLQTKAVIDVITNKQYSQLSQIPDAPDPLPPWNSQPETSSAEEPSATPLAAPPT